MRRLFLGILSQEGHGDTLIDDQNLSRLSRNLDFLQNSVAPQHRSPKCVVTDEVHSPWGGMGLSQNTFMPPEMRGFLYFVRNK